MTQRPAPVELTGADCVVRRIRAGEWLKVKELRLAALADPAAPIAFLETFDGASKQPDQFWMDRAAGAAEGSVAQFIAEDSSGAWLGSLVVIVFEAGSEDYWGKTVAARRANVVGVFIHPENRGKGLIEALFAAGKEFAVAQGLDTLYLEVHRDNVGARRAYERAGFVLTGEILESEAGIDDEMVARLR